ncbi:tautomerase family protein [Microbacterium resistens]|uniref:tautomerase family protein n=1 Tax=Microbacterium resistens TaxID=156977 RepID=UPI001C582FA8|nr:tautomerase family protein [Microbacterium resistens]MBW1637525.1 tautomerase family protein [Microbacterium resistens]
MPLVKINLLEGRSTSEKYAIAAAVQAALVTNLGVPDADHYQIFNEFPADNFRHTDSYLGLNYTEQLLIIEITFLVGRTDEIKKALLADINRNLVAAGVVSSDDVFVTITEIGLANISFGGGLAQRAPADA